MKFKHLFDIIGQNYKQKDDRVYWVSEKKVSEQVIHRSITIFVFNWQIDRLESLRSCRTATMSLDSNARRLISSSVDLSPNQLHNSSRDSYFSQELSRMSLRPLTKDYKIKSISMLTMIFVLYVKGLGQAHLQQLLPCRKELHN